MRRRHLREWAAWIAMAGSVPVAAQAPPPQPAQARAPVDLTGYWVSVVTEDWRWRMMTPPKLGDFTSVPLNAAGLHEAQALGLGEGRLRRQSVQTVRRWRDHAHARPAAHHVAGPEHAQNRNRRWHANPAAAQLR